MILEKKKVLLINWPLLDVGGITTWNHQIIKGFQKIGWQADNYYATPTGTYKTSETEFIPIGGKFKRGEKIPSKTLGFFGDENIEKYKILVENYDYVIFVHPSPHPTKSNKADSRIISWQRLYKECNKPKVVVFHDKKWNKTNEWFKDVANYVDVVLAAQHNFIESTTEYSNLGNKPILTDWLYFPLDVEGINPFELEREQRLCMCPQWIKWKKHIELLKDAFGIVLPIHFYNGGMEYHKIVWTEPWNKSILIDWVEDTYVNKEAKHEYHGFKTYEDIKKVYKKSLGSIDLTTRTYQNYTHHECSLYGCVLLCTEECRQGPYNHIHDGEFWPIDMDDITGSINSFCDISEDSRRNIVLPAHLRTVENFDCRKIAMKINSLVESLKI